MMQQKTLETKTHHWGGLTEYYPDGEEILNVTDGETEGIIKILKKMKVNQYYVAYTINAEIKNTNSFNKTIQELKNYGVDIGGGNCEYGYKMPLPEKNEGRRKLIIFRRKIA